MGSTTVTPSSTRYGILAIRPENVPRLQSAPRSAAHRLALHTRSSVITSTALQLSATALPNSRRRTDDYSEIDILPTADPRPIEREDDVTAVEELRCWQIGNVHADSGVDRLGVVNGPPRVGAPVNDRRR